MSKSIAALVFAGLVFTAPALAQDLGLSEIRGGVFVHSADEPGDLFGVFSVERMQDVNVELLFDVPGMSSWLAWGELRPHLGATVNFQGLESMVYGGVSWTVPIADSPVFVEASFGGALHNGNTQGNAVYPARNLGCGLVFRESVSLGVKLNDNAAIMATAEHASNANLCDNGNRGLTNMGIRFGYRF
ncbi:acyloxyacyl hydrolase [Devosia sp. FJ2-5-3]|uniref:acyloxyacyl hydrolase n=1 Tax=Devosia sp. FJ2-5-3 TaxID=2976680 RepID=UPI0023D8C05C|nr:acyloxyacyl hydrolase [Devosia sp. FJ2-5-3]WEJ58740.1 acyloxyacyl hydrolase [Devosia sp. FJ2-5-3]